MRKVLITTLLLVTAVFNVLGFDEEDEVDLVENDRITASEFAKFLQRYSDNDSLFYIFSNRAYRIMENEISNEYRKEKYILKFGTKEAGYLNPKILDTLDFCLAAKGEEVYGNDTIRRIMFKVLSDSTAWINLIMKEYKRCDCADTAYVISSLTAIKEGGNPLRGRGYEIKSNPKLYKYYCDSLSNQEDMDRRKYLSNYGYLRETNFCNIAEMLGKIRCWEAYDILKKHRMCTFFKADRFFEIRNDIRNLDYREAFIERYKNSELISYESPRIREILLSQTADDSDAEMNRRIEPYKKRGAKRLPLNVYECMEVRDLWVDRKISLRENYQDFEDPYVYGNPCFYDCMENMIEIEDSTFFTDEVLMYYSACVADDAEKYFEQDHKIKNWKEEVIFKENLYWLKDAPYFKEFKRERVALAFDRYAQRIETLGNVISDSMMSDVLAKAAKSKKPEVKKLERELKSVIAKAKNAQVNAAGLLTEAESVLNRTDVSEKEWNAVVLKACEATEKFIDLIFEKIRTAKMLNATVSDKEPLKIKYVGECDCKPADPTLPPPPPLPPLWW